MAACTDLKYRHYNGGWSSWQSYPKLRDGYAGSSKYITCIQFKTPAVSSLYKDTSLSITIPWVRQSRTAKSGTLYIKLHTSDPTGCSGTGTIPNSSNCDASAAWSASNLQVNTSSFTITKSLSPSTVYYLTIGNSTNFLEIGYSDSDAAKFVFTFNCTEMTGPSTTDSTVTISDNYNNTFKVEGTLGRAGTNNSYKYTECFLWWTQAKANASTWQWYSSSDKNGNIYTFTDNTTSKSVDGLAINITDNGAADKQVYARVTTASTYGAAVDKYSLVTNIRQYCAPTPATERPTLTYSKSRLTVRENWTFSWHEGTPANDSSPIKGYEIRITKNKVEIPNLTISSNGVITKGTSGGSTYLYWTNTSSLQVTCNPENLGFAAKDKVVFWVRPYTRYGKNYDGDLLPSGWPAHTATVEATVQNAAVVNKYDNASSKWQEGIACVYKNGSWVEADSVLVYKNGNWVEST